MADGPERPAVRRAGCQWPHLARLARRDIARRAWLDAGRPGPRPEFPRARRSAPVAPEERAARRAAERGEREARNAAILGRVAAGENPREVALVVGVSPALVYKLMPVAAAGRPRSGSGYAPGRCAGRRGADARGAAVWMLGRGRRGVCVGNQTRGVSMNEKKAPAVRPSGDAAVMVADLPVVKTDGDKRGVGV